MQTQTSLCPSIYKVRQLAGGKYSLVDDKGEVKQLRIGKFKRVTFDMLLIFRNGRILAKFKQRGCYSQECLFNADLTPIALPIGKVKRVTFDMLAINNDGKIRAQCEDEFYLFNADLTPILTSI